MKKKFEKIPKIALKNSKKSVNYLKLSFHGLN